jgi:hypothetical protein
VVLVGKRVAEWVDTTSHPKIGQNPVVTGNKESPEQARGIEDFSLKYSRIWGNKSPTPPVFRSKLRGIKPKEI